MPQSRDRRPRLSARIPKFINKKPSVWRTDEGVCPYFVGVISGHIHASWETFPPFGKAWGDSHRSKEMNWKAIVSTQFIYF